MRKIFYTLIMFGLLTSCNYLDVVPDNVATLDYAFRNRSSALRYLATCYSKLPDFGNAHDSNPGIAGADELWVNSNNTGSFRPFFISLGQQNKNEVLVDYWNGRGNGKNIWEGIRDCNIFLENIDKVVEMSREEKDRWKAEVKFLKAFYHYYLLISYGPIPIMDENFPLNVTPHEISGVVREPVDKVFQYILDMLEDCIANGLPDRVEVDMDERGRVTKPIAMAFKGKVLLYHASPLFNGNVDYPNFKNNRNEQLFNPVYDAGRWEKAEAALREAIDYCHGLGYALHYFQPDHTVSASPQTQQELTLRTAITERWNPEIIWGETNSLVDRYQTGCLPRFNSHAADGGKGLIGVTLNMVEKFYSENGVPIEEDFNYPYEDIYATPIAASGSNGNFYVKDAYVTSPMNLNREPRFYAYLAFDGNLWFGQSAKADATRYLIDRAELRNHPSYYSQTGYYAKKIVNYLSAHSTATTWTPMAYPFPMIRLADLYLMYAEASNEAHGPNSEVYHYLNQVRERAGLETVQHAWATYSRIPDKYNRKDGLRDIIRRERTIELAFEGSRFWDLRRWKTASLELNQNILGWDVLQPDANAYYRPIVLHQQTFGVKDYFWPIRVDEMVKSPDIVQSPGW
ncbi:MAG TPA: RagB/SusD family nutrient uptake outer membrane protein [Sphingobacterium sp.]|nr:RagB/SusD family nutrient uptake outer membrane protein [Sphingobacterium sp.]